MEVRTLSSCGLTIRQYMVKDRAELNSPTLFADLSVADYVEFVIFVDGRAYHYPYKVVPTSYGELLLVRAESYGDDRLAKHKASVCPFRRCRHVLGPLSNVRFVVRVFGLKSPDPVVRVA